MMQQNFNPSLVGQQGLSQQQIAQQPQVGQQSVVPGLTDPANAHMWQQIQNQRLQQHPQFRPQLGGAIGGGVNQQQMLELIRNQNLRQAVAQRQQQQAQQVFPLPGQMNSNPSASFLDSSASNIQQQFNLGSLGNSGNPAMLQMIHNQAGAGGQLDSLGLGHQPNQSMNATQMLAFRQQLQQQQQQQALNGQINGGQLQGQLGQGGFFLGSNLQPDRAQASPMPSQVLNNAAMANRLALLQQSQPQPQQNLMTTSQGNAANIANVLGRRPGGPYTTEELRSRATALQSLISALEKSMLHLQTARASRPDAEYFAEMAKLQKEYAGRKALLGKIASMLEASARGAQAVSGAQGGQPGGAVSMTFPPANQQVQGPSAQSSASWLPQNGSSSTVPFSGAQPQQGGAQLVPNAQGQQHLMNLQAMQQARNFMPPRTVTTPQQRALSGLPQTSPNMASIVASQFSSPSAQSAAAPDGANTLHTGTQHRQPSPAFPSLPQEAFEQAFRTWCQMRSLHVDERHLTFEDKKIDLHKLHHEVLSMGGFQKVQENEWSIIAGKLGIVQFPGSATEPPRSGPGAAAQVQNAYNTYLKDFERAYLQGQNTEPSSREPQPTPGAGTPGSGMGGGQPNMPQASLTNGTPMLNASVPPNGAQSIGPQQHINSSVSHLSALIGIKDPNMLKQVLGLAFLSIEDMRARNVPHPLIEKVQVHRDILQRTALSLRQNNAIQQQTQKMFAAQALRNGSVQPQQPQTAPGGLIVPRPPVPNAMNAAQITPKGPQQPAIPSGPENNATAVPRTMRRPTPEELNKANLMVQAFRQQYQAIVRGFPLANVPETQRAEFNQHLPDYYRLAHDIEPRLALCACFMKDDGIRKLVQIIVTAQYQRELMSSAAEPRYALTLNDLKMVVQQLQQAHHALRTMLSLTGGAQPMAPPNQTPLPATPQMPQTQPMATQPAAAGHSQLLPTGVPAAQTVPQLGVAQSHPTPYNASSPQQHIPIQTPRSQPVSLPVHHPQTSPRSTTIQSTPTPASATVPKRKAPATPADNAASMTTPPASIPTPIANASTPSHPATPAHVAGSPQTPKSPKPKAPPKPRPVAKKKPTMKGPPTPSAAPVAEQSSPAPPVAQPATPETGSKRPREEEALIAPPIIGEPSPPKKPRTEWDGPVSDELAKRQREADAIQGPEDAEKFVEKMTNLLKMAGEGPVFDESFAKLSQILKPYGGESSDPDLLLGDSDFGSAGQSSVDMLQQYFDFSSYGLEDAPRSKTNTPVLDPSSANPSPRSGSESDHNLSADPADTVRIADPKGNDLFDATDGLSFGDTFKELDGGETAYHSSELWKWDGAMSGESTWAFTS